MKRVLSATAAALAMSVALAQEPAPATSSLAFDWSQGDGVPAEGFRVLTDGVVTATLGPTDRSVKLSDVTSGPGTYTFVVQAYAGSEAANSTGLDVLYYNVLGAPAGLRIVIE